MTACTAITGHLLRTGRPEEARPWLVFTCDRGEKAECARLAALPAAPAP